MTVAFSDKTETKHRNIQTFVTTTGKTTADFSFFYDFLIFFSHLFLLFVGNSCLYHASISDNFVVKRRDIVTWTTLP